MVRRRWASVLRSAGAALALLPAGCERAATPPRYEVFNGSVVSRQTDTGALTVARPAARSAEPREVACIVTSDSEIYVNDRLSTIGEIRRGDAVEIFGYRDPNPRLAGFVVTVAYVTRGAEAGPAGEESP